ncbi:hypothetical protein KBD61_05445 [Patescibacteria group bacterium]|nr:hypothetical protein [Patescibacteria group bacterium]MBP9710435.1 hypothetical protein [Patescibacteria group bacterium]
MTTKTDDKLTYVRVGNGPFRAASEAVLRLQVEMHRLQADIATSDAELQTTRETEPARRTAFKRMHVTSSFGLLFLITAAAIPRLTIYTGLAFWISVFIGALSILVGDVRRQRGQQYVDDIEDLLLEEGARITTSVIFIALHLIYLYLLHAWWPVWLLSLIYYLILSMQISFRRMHVGRNVLLLNDRLTKAGKEVERLVSDSPNTSDMAHILVTTKEIDASHGADPEKLALARRR